MSTPRPFVVLPLFLSATSLVGQCATQPLSLGGSPGASYSVAATVAWDADGAGPAAAVPVIVGPFRAAGSAVVNGIARYDATTNDWAGFGGGLTTSGAPGSAGWYDGSGHAALPLPNGDLVVGGVFTSAGGATAAHVAVWTNGAWAPLGSGTNGEVRCLGRLPGGEILVGGSFTQAGGAPADNLAVWNGSTWAQFGGGRPWAVTSLAVLANGDVAVGGASGATVWNGAWTSLTSQPVYSMSPAPGGGLVWSSRYFTWSPSPPPFGSSVEVPFVAKTVGSVTTYLITGQLSRALAWLPNGDLLAAWGYDIQRWDGTQWTPYAANVYGTVQSLQPMPNGDLIAAGWLEEAGGVTVEHVAAWNGQGWRRLGTGLGLYAAAVVQRPNGDLVVGGAFGFAGTPGACMARWNGSQWSSPGAGVFAPFGAARNVNEVVALPNGDVVAVGSFAAIGGVAAANVARWDGANWWPLGAGVNGAVHSAILRSNGQLVVGGSFTSPGDDIAQWDGVAWSSFGVGSDGYVTVLAEAPNGDLIAAGSFVTMAGIAASNIARWTGSGWQPLGAGVSHSVYSVAFLQNGDLVAGGWFTAAGGAPANRIARWDGVSWSPLGAGLNSLVTSLLVLPDGDLLAGGGFTSAGGTPVSRMARWNGTNWSAFGGGVSDDLVGDMRLLSTGEIALAGRFRVVDGISAGSVVLLAPTCPAAAAPAGAGCTGAGGANQLAAVALPWIGSTFRARATGFAPNSLAVSVFGFGSAAVPLAAVLPQGLPGCTLWATPDLLAVQLPVAGAVATQVAIPDVGALVGFALHHQVVAIELDAAANIVALTGSNALGLTIGAL